MITSLFEAMGFIMAIWLVVAAVFAGTGALAYRAVGASICRADDVFALFWVGWALAIVYVQIWHLVLPIDMRVWVIPACTGAYGCWRSRQAFRAIIAQGTRHRYAAIILIGLVALWTANHAMAPLVDYDAGVYHLPTVQWENAYPIVPGLGNLFWPLAHNTSAFLYMAMLNAGPLAGTSYNLADSLLLVVFLAQLVVSLVRVCRPQRPDPSDIVLALFIVPTGTYTLTLCYGVASMSNDIIVFILEVLVTTQVLRMLTVREEASTMSTRLLYITFLVAVGVTVKLTFAVLGGAAIAVAILVLTRTGRQAWHVKRSLLLSLTFAVLLPIVPWMIRGVIVSGYPLYPEQAFAFPVPWRMPVAQVIFDNDILLGFSRFPGPMWRESLGNWHWIQPWLARNGKDFLLPLSLFVLVVAVAALRRRSMTNKAPSTAWLCLLPSGIGVVAWFVMAPDPRYAGALFWLLATGAIALAFARESWTARTIIICLVMALAVFQHSDVVPVAIDPVKPGPIGGLYGVPSVPLKAITVGPRLTVYVPARGDQLWAAPLPSTPQPPVGLRLRCAGTLRCGFVIR